MKCSICGKQIEKSMYSNDVLCSSECFKIDYWNGKVKIVNDADVVRVNGEHYYIGKEDENFKGYGGRRFKVSFFDGRIVETTCLWNNGTIPESFKHKLPDNARFV